jgi:hypothetical protein
VSLEADNIVAGRRMSASLSDHVMRCEALILEEQERPNPDNALIAVLCDSVRLARERADRAAVLNARGEPCPECGQTSRAETAGCDHCDFEDK